MSIYYRLYLRDSRGHFLSVIEFHCPEDLAAIAEVEVRGISEAKELWDRGRLVKSWCAAPA